LIALTKPWGGCLGRKGPEGAILLGVELVSVDLHLRIDPGSDPISGSVEQTGREPVQFRGWIDLVAAIEDARASVTAVRALGWLPGARLVDSQLT
jgi:hypothetical protein